MKQRRASPEEALQRSVAELFARILPQSVFWTAINPIPAKSKAAAGISKAMGMRKGVPDILIIHRGEASWVELKAPKGVVSGNQRETGAALHDAGCHRIAVCRSLPEVIGTLKGWGIPLLNARVAA